MFLWTVQAESIVLLKMSVIKNENAKKLSVPLTIIVLEIIMVGQNVMVRIVLK